MSEFPNDVIILHKFRRIDVMSYVFTSRTCPNAISFVQTPCPLFCPTFIEVEVRVFIYISQKR